jgi:hypothetical protein
VLLGSEAVVALTDIAGFNRELAIDALGAAAATPVTRVTSA